MSKLYEIINCSEEDCEELFHLRCQVEEYTTNLFKECRYLDFCDKEIGKSAISTRTKTKSLNDTIWGTIDIEEREFFIIDSPIIQRLRRIKQLGFVDYLYSSATHSRFSHSLGVLKVATQMFDKIYQELQSQDNYNINISYEKLKLLIRTAALFHDCGHLGFGNSMETFLEENRNCISFDLIQKIKYYFYQNINLKPDLVRILAMLILNSSPVIKLLELVGVLDSSPTERQEGIDILCCLMIGYPYSLSFAPFSQIINGPIDSNKMDYLKRDSFQTGVPIAVDMSRILQKIRAVKNTRKINNLSKSETSDIAFYELGITYSAINTVDHLSLSGYLMFENVYCHQKVITIEAMFQKALSNLNEEIPNFFGNFANILSLSDSISALSQRLLKKDGKNHCDSIKLNQSLDILSRINFRRVPKKVMNISGDTFTKVDNSYNSVYSDIFGDNNYKQILNITSRIEEELVQILKLLNVNHNNDLDICIVSKPTTRKLNFEKNTNVAVEGVIERNNIFESDNWLKSRDSRKQFCFISCNEVYKEYAYIAIEKVFLDDYKVRIKNDSFAISINADTLYKSKLKLFKLGYYNNHQKILFMPNFLDEKIEDCKLLQDKWIKYDRKSDISSGTTITAESILNFVHQFIIISTDINEFQNFVDECFHILNKVQYISYESISELFSSNLSTLMDEKKD